MKEITINQSNWLYRYATWLREKTDCNEPIETICDLTSTVVFRTIAVIIFFVVLAYTGFLGIYILSSLIWGWFATNSGFIVTIGCVTWALILFLWFKYRKENGHDGIVYEMYRNFKDKTCVKLNIVKG